jgi:hypothetical protein
MFEGASPGAAAKQIMKILKNPLFKPYIDEMIELVADAVGNLIENDGSFDTQAYIEGIIYGKAAKKVTTKIKKDWTPTKKKGGKKGGKKLTPDEIKKQKLKNKAAKQLAKQALEGTKKKAIKNTVTKAKEAVVKSIKQQKVKYYVEKLVEDPATSVVENHAIKPTVEAVGAPIKEGYEIIKNTIIYTRDALGVIQEIRSGVFDDLGNLIEGGRLFNITDTQSTHEVYENGKVVSTTILTK